MKLGLRPVRLRDLLHAGPPHHGGPACEDRHCWSCGRDGPARWAVVCGECFHAWRFGWLLSLADARAYYRSGRAIALWHGDSLPADPWWRRFRLRRPSKVYVCPCCTHDL